jgi:membrane protease YdiL (CAAX protease family)
MPCGTSPDQSPGRGRRSGKTDPVPIPHEERESNMVDSKGIRTVGGFTLVCFLFSWPIFFCVDAWLEPMFSRQGNAAAAGFSVLFGHMLGMLGPALAALFMWRVFHKESPPAWKWSRPAYYGWAALAMLAFWALPGLIGLLFGDTVDSSVETHIRLMIAAIIGLGWITGMGEEIGWCAYLLPQLSRTNGKTRAMLVSNILRGLWHWPVVVSPVIAQVGAGERTLPQLLGASVVIAFQLVLSNVFFGSIFGWIWYKTESMPLVGWLHYWYDMIRDITIMLLVGYGTGLWVSLLNPFVLLPVGFILLNDVLVGEGLDWRRLLGIKKTSQPGPAA